MSEALRLAALVDHGSDSTQIERDVSAELRRLHTLNAELVEALRGIVALWDHHSSAHGDGVIYPLHEKARAALAKARESK